MHDREHLVSLFYTKFFHAEAQFSVSKLGLIWEASGKDLDTYVKRFHDKAVDYCNPLEEEVLVNVCLHRMQKEYCIFLENLSSQPSPSWWTSSLHQQVST